jgi:hypothetical protein
LRAAGGFGADFADRVSIRRVEALRARFVGLMILSLLAPKSSPANTSSIPLQTMNQF